MSPDSSSYQDFLNEYPDSKYAPEVQKVLENINKRKKSEVFNNRYKNAKVMSKGEIGALLKKMQDEMLPFKIQKLFSGYYKQATNTPVTPKNPSVVYLSSSFAGKSSPVKRISLFFSGDEMNNFSQKRIQNGKAFSISIATYESEGHLKQITAYKKEGEVSLSDLESQKVENVGPTIFYIYGPVKPATKGLNDFRYIKIHMPGTLKGEYINNGTGKWRKE